VLATALPPCRPPILPHHLLSSLIAIATPLSSPSPLHSPQRGVLAPSSAIRTHHTSLLAPSHSLPAPQAALLSRASASAVAFRILQERPRWIVFFGNRRSEHFFATGGSLRLCVFVVGSISRRREFFQLWSNFV
jgi:hypothetical protein